MSGSDTASSISSEEDDDYLDVIDPPLFNYSRIKKKLPVSLFSSRDSIASTLFTKNFLAFGTHQGILHLTTTNFSPIKSFKCHKSSILTISTDSNTCSNFATASIDGTVVIGNYLDPDTSCIAYNFKRPVSSVILDHDYEKSKLFFSGGMACDLIMSQKNWLGNRIDTILNKKLYHDGPIQAIHQFGNNVIIWFNEDGINFYDLSTKTFLFNQPFPNSDNTRPELFKPFSLTIDASTFVVCWCNNIWFFKITCSNSNTAKDVQQNFSSLLSTAASTLKIQSDTSVSLQSHFLVNFIIAGVCSYKNDQLLLLAFENKDLSSTITTTQPELKIIDSLTGEEIYSDQLVSKNLEKLSINDFHLDTYIDKDSKVNYFLTNPNDIIHIKPLTLEDHYYWYIDNDNLIKAWEIGKYVVSEEDRFQIAVQYLDKLLDQKNWELLKTNMVKIFLETDFTKEDGDLFKDLVTEKWERFIMSFLENNKIDLIIDFIPVDFPLNKTVYNSILTYYLENNNLDLFSKYLREWPLTVYEPKILEVELEEKLKLDDEKSMTYRRDLIYLYSKQSKYSKAIPHMLKAKDITALDIMLSHDLLSQFMDDVVDIVLLPFNGEIKEFEKLPLGEIEFLLQKPIQLLIENRYSISINKIIQLFSNPATLRIVIFMYLKNLTRIDASITSFEDLMIELYFEYDKLNLLQFLKEKNNYNVEKAIDFCSKDPESYNELIYLWSKIGETKRALSLIIDKLNDPDVAIEFVKNCGDSELWEFMVGYSMDKPLFVKALLNSPDEVGKTHLEIIKAMPLKMEIDTLPETLEKLLKENFLTLTVSNNVYKIIDDETNTYTKELLALRVMGKIFNDECM
ncbi:hypothetical protein Kpol_1055p37 [Vanderwaltozyma polyspora DSM 70294]|uniref:Vps41 beta-propeller domain-containing protein n=1 Tax=Vanderwaltozyma polyspora (strain ATCC 22028 / DSM 70294 / BCRC 21397 / CBS 2163 / NBRC 10782 / NRRL Y-8283 / UCD 57-17) TaxID=436907 RepID=A7TGB2_VANPO|nr:uncharacterized protein Kpol_1055p37 [Vanderwaltozyma polyspora DSM 70294]EDO18682.1 hypothetical protein Kpol_1055p37 [Vanderwaltozyma polyspora DSM 70294]